jgi:hypothetical protein
VPAQVQVPLRAGRSLLALMLAFGVIAGAGIALAVVHWLGHCTM